MPMQSTLGHNTLINRFHQSLDNTPNYYNPNYNNLNCFVMLRAYFVVDHLSRTILGLVYLTGNHWKIKNLFLLKGFFACIFAKCERFFLC